MASIDIKFSGATKELEASVNKIAHQLMTLDKTATSAGEHIDAALDGAGSGARTAAQALSGAAGEMANLESMAKKAGTAIAGYLALDQVMAFGDACIEVRKEFESLEVSFATLLGSEQKGKAMFDSLTKFATTTPLMEKDIASAAQTLLGFNIAEEKVLPMLKAIGDVSMGDAQKFQSLTLAFAQATSAGKLMGQDLMQMINAGFNPLGELARTTGKSIGQLKKEMEEGKISAKMLEDAFVSATSEGGKYNGMLENMSKTMAGAKSNLDGAIQKFQGAIGEAMQPIFVEIVNRAYETVNEITAAFEEIDLDIDAENLKEVMDGVIKAAKTAVVVFGTYKAAELAMAAATTAANFAIGVQAAEMGVLANAQLIATLATAKFTKAMKALTASLMSNPYILIAGALAAFVGYIYATSESVEKLEYKLNTLETAQKSASESTEEERKKLGELRKTAEDTNETMENRKKAVDALQSQYPDYFKNLSDEQIMCGDVGDAYKRLTDDILSAAKARAAFEQMTENEKEILRLKEEMDKMDKKRIRNGQQILKNDKTRSRNAALMAVGTEGANAFYGGTANLIAEENRRMALHAGALFNAIDKLKKANKDLAKIAKKDEQTPPTTPTTPKKTTTGKSKEELMREARELVSERYKAFGKALEDVSEKEEQAIVKSYQRTIENTMRLRIDAMDSEHEDALEAIQANLASEKEAMEKAAKELYEAQLKLEVAQGKRKKEDLPTYSRERLKDLLPDVDKILSEQEATLDGAARNLTDFENAAYKKQWRDLYDELLSTSEDYLLKREAMEKDFSKRIAEAQVALGAAPAEQKAKIKAYIAGLQKEMSEALSQMDNSKFEELIGLDSMLGNVEGYSAKQLDAMAESLEKVIAANNDLTPDGIQKLKSLQEALSQLYRVRLEKDPSKEIRAATEALKRSKRELDAALADKAKADAFVNFDKNGGVSSYGQEWQTAMTEGDTQRLAELSEMLVLVNGQWVKYGDVLQRANVAQDAFGKALERSKNAAEKSFAQFQKVLGVVGKAGNAISSLGGLLSTLGKSKLGKVAETMAEIGDLTLSAVSDIKSTVFEASKSISDVTTAAAEGATGAAEGASAAISTVEKASVILTIISVALQVVTKIFNLFKDMHNADIEEQIKKYDRQIDKLKDNYEDLEEVVNKTYSTAAVKNIKEQNRNLEKQNQILKEQMELEKQKKQSDDELQDALKTYQDKIRENTKLIEANKEAMVEAIMGEDVKRAIDRFAEAIADAWANEGTIKENAKKAVKTMLKNMVLESMKQDLSEPVRNLQERMMAMYGQNGIMTQEQIASFEREAELLARKMEEKYGFANDVFKSLDASFSGTSGGFQTMSQESADELNGRFAQAQGAVQGTYEAMLESSNTLLLINGTLASIKQGFDDLQDNVATANGYLSSIDANIDKMTKNLVPTIGRIEYIIKTDR